MSTITPKKLKLPTRGGRVASRGRGPVFTTAVAVIAITIAVVIAVVSFNAPNRIPLRSYYDLQAEFADADNLAKHYQVRLGGRQVGQVLDPHLENGKALVKLRLDKDVQPLKSDTTLRVRPRSLIGVRFVELIPGTKGRELNAGETIPITQTDSTVQIDTLLDALDPQTRDGLRSLLVELGSGVQGRGEGLARTVQSAPDLFEALEGTAGSVNRLRPDALGRLVQGGRDASVASDPVRNDIANGFRPGAKALRPFVDRADAVQDALEEAPETFAQGAPDLAETQPMLRALDRFAVSAGDTLEPAPGALRETARLLDDGRPGLRDAESALRLAQDAVDPALELLRTVDPVRAPLDTAFVKSAPQLEELGDRRCDFRYFDNWAGITERGNSGGNYLHFNIPAGPESFAGRDPARGPSPQIRQNPYPEPCATGRDGSPDVYPGVPGPEPLPKGRP